jgi:hypothetical protein
MVKVHSIQVRRRRVLFHTGGTPGHRRVSHHLRALSAAWRFCTRAPGDQDGAVSTFPCNRVRSTARNARVVTSPVREVAGIFLSRTRY